jgi:hypothetical protein
MHATDVRLNHLLGCLLGGEARGGIHHAYARRNENFDAEDDAEDALEPEQARTQARAQTAVRAARERVLENCTSDILRVRELTVKIRRGADIKNHPELRQMLELLETPLLAMYDALVLERSFSLELDVAHDDSFWERLENAYDDVVTMVRPFYSLQRPRMYSGTIEENLRDLVQILVFFGRDCGLQQNLSLETETKWHALVSKILCDLDDVGDGRVEDLCEHFRIAFHKFYKACDTRVARQGFEAMHVALERLEQLVGATGVGHIAADVRALEVIVVCYGREYFED